MPKSPPHAVAPPAGGVLRVLIAGGRSILAQALRPHLSRFASVVTAGRHGCDLFCDLHPGAPSLAFPEGLDVVVHAAAHFGGLSTEAIREAYEVNVLGTLRLCEAAARAGARHVLLLSTIFAQTPDLPAPQRAYALSKRHGEEAAALLAGLQGIPLTVVRPSRIYGDDDAFRKHQPLIYSMADQAQQGRSIRIDGPRDPLRNYLHVEDLCRLLVQLICHPSPGVYPCCHPQDVTLSRIARAALAAFGSHGSVDFETSRPSLPDQVVPFDSTVYDHIGFRPQISIEDGFQRIARHRGRHA